MTLAVAALLAPAVIHAQDNVGEQAAANQERMMDRQKKMEAQKAAYLTREMELTPEESKTFWPVYNKYRDEVDNLAKRRDQALGLNTQDSQREITRDELERQMKTKFEMERARIDLDEKYYGEFKSILPPDKLLRFYEADVQFKRDLLQKLAGERRGMSDEEMMERRRKMQQQNAAQQKEIQQKSE